MILGEVGLFFSISVINFRFVRFRFVLFKIVVVG